MRLYSAHLKVDAEPLLVREGFSWGALIFGPLWLAAHRAWIAAAISLAAGILIVTLAPTVLSLILLAGLAVLLGLLGHDLRRWTAERQGYLLVHVVAARGAEDALQRLLIYRPDLTDRYLRDAL